MRDICIDKDFVALNTWICNSGVYVITWGRKGGQLELALMLGVFSEVEILYVKLDKCEDLNQLVQVIRWQNSEKQLCVVLDCVSKEILNRTLVFLYDLHNDSKVMAVIGICDREIRDVIYRYDALIYGELKTWLRKYTEAKGITISKKCHWEIRKILLG